MVSNKANLCAIVIAQLLFGLNVFSQIPGGYYDNAESKSDQVLRVALHNIIDDHQEYGYSSSSSTDAWDILKESDVDPNNSNNVLLIYTGESVNGENEYDGGNGWNREHVWAKSRGDFGTATGAGSDVHNLRASNIPVNSTRSNYSFDNCTNNCSQTFGNFYSGSSLIFEPRDQDKGDVARIIFYMDLRYEGDNGEVDLEMTESIPSITNKAPRHGVRSTLLEWHELDPVDDFERNRNNVIYQYQDNRNPFIDHPELVDYIWGDKQNMAWSSTLSMAKPISNISIQFPNPVDGDFLNLTLSSHPQKIELFDAKGRKMNQYLGTQNQILAPTTSGIYFLRFTYKDEVINKRLIVKASS